jgi:hypothetical protein
MNARVIQRRGESSSVLMLDRKTRSRLRRLGQMTKLLVNEQDPTRWTSADNPNYLRYVSGGAIVLQQIGVLNKDKLYLESAGAHMAFMACTFLALFIPRLNVKDQISLKMTLKILALCCPVKVDIQKLPPLSHLPESFQASSVLRRQYVRFEEIIGTPGGVDVSLADALALQRIFEKATDTTYASEVHQLRELTEGLRTALYQLRDVPL